ncbi:MAG: YlbE-like family protein [Bacilli bacterium]|jgi:lipocalin
MNLDIQFKLKNNYNYTRYIRENSHWYKVLSRNPERFNDFVNAMKEQYRLRPTDKISDATDKLELIKTFFNFLK